MTQYASTVLPKTIFKQRKATILSAVNVTRKNVYQNEFKCFILMFNIILKTYYITSSTLFFVLWTGFSFDIVVFQLVLVPAVGKQMIFMLRLVVGICL